MKILFLDDDPVRHTLFTRALTEKARENLYATFDVPQAIAALQEHSPFDIAFLDHDLGGRIYVEEREGTGTEVADFIRTLDPALQPALVIVHSFNPAGAARMLSQLHAGGCAAEQHPFGSPQFVAYVEHCNEY